MEENQDRQRIEELIEVVMKVARGDYNVQCNLSGKNDSLDALAMGLNMMIDDLKNNVDLKLQHEKIKNINSELKEAKEKAQENDRLKSAFLANMSHEIRSPMNAIMGFSELLGRKNITPEKHHEFLSYILNAGNQLLALIDDIIDISKIESNQLKIDKHLFNVNELLHQVYEIVIQDKRLKSKPELQFIYNYKEDADHYFINTDPVRFKQILINLISNSIKFTDTGYVELGYTLIKKEKNTTINLYVKDSGRGIPVDSQNIIFGRFTQIHFDQYQEGAGLGLSITKGLVELLGGNISFESELDKGSVFYVSFPCEIKEDRLIEEVSKACVDHSVDLSDYSIYITEDKIVAYIYLEEILTPYGIKLKHAGNGKELISLIEEKIPDLVLLDIQMPVMNGYETIKEIRRRKYTFPVIAQTAYATDDEHQAIINSGCNGYLTKPIQPDILIHELQKQLIS